MVLREQLLGCTPVQALVVIPVVLRGGDDPGRPEAGPLEAVYRLGEIDEPPLDLDEVLEPLLGCESPRRFRKRREDLDCRDAAAVDGGEDPRRPALPRGDVEDAAAIGQPQVVAEAPDLLRARGVLELVVALDDVPRPELPSGSRAAR
jgi:hypothetical protein